MFLAFLYYYFNEKKSQYWNKHMKIHKIKVWNNIYRNYMTCKIISFMLYIYKFLIILIAHSGLKKKKIVLHIISGMFVKINIFKTFSLFHRLTSWMLIVSKKKSQTLIFAFDFPRLNFLRILTHFACSGHQNNIIVQKMWLITTNAF